MAAPDTPFDLSISDGRDDQVPLEERTPAFRAPGQDLESEKLEMGEPRILQQLSSYFEEAENARETGFEPRHEVWEENLHAFWMRKEFPEKMDWQSREVSSAVPNYVERFSAVQRQDLTQNREWPRVRYLRDPHAAQSEFATRITRLALDFAGSNASGHPVPFEHVFGNVCASGALMMMCAAVVVDRRNGRISVEQVDPRQCYWDPTGRGLYRVRFWEVDKETLLRKAEMVDERGDPLYDAEAIEEVVAHHDRRIDENRAVSTGAGTDVRAERTPILVKEWLCDLTDRAEGPDHGRRVRERQLIVVANDHRIIRGPERNPNWHGKDWIVGHPVLQAPLRTPEGRTYVEMFRHAVETHENVTNRILDIASSRIDAHEIDPAGLDRPEDLEGGIAPGQVILRSEEALPGEQAIRPITLGGQVPADLLRIWDATRREMQEAAAQSDLSLGHTVQSGETTATEAALSERGQSALNNSIAIDIDLGFLTPITELVYFTALQHVDRDFHGIWNGLPENERAMLEAARDDFRIQPIVVRAEGLTQAVQRRVRMRSMLAFLNVVGGNPALVEAYQRGYSLDKLLRLLMEDFGVSISKIELSERERVQKAEEQGRARAQQQMQEMLGQGGAGAGRPQPTAQNQGGTDPAAPGAAEGLPGEARAL